MGVVITCREYAGITPLGMTFSEMASMTGGGVQTPGFMGNGKHYIASHKFLKAEGGVGRLVWLPKELKDQIRDKLNETAKDMYDIDNFADMVADETNCPNGDPEELLAYLSEVGLCARDYVNREVNDSLSGGELKRIEIATMLARGTKMSIFDEPEAGIDLWSFQNLISVFEKMHETIHGSILIISHQERILETADKIVVLVDGEVRTIGTKDEIMPVLMEASRVCSRLADKV